MNLRAGIALKPRLSSFPEFLQKVQFVHYLSVQKTHSHNVTTHLSFCLHSDINMIYPIPDFHLNLITGFLLMPRKPTSRYQKSFYSNGRPETPPTDITLRGKLDKSNIPALRVMYPFEIARQRSDRAQNP